MSLLAIFSAALRTFSASEKREYAICTSASSSFAIKEAFVDLVEHEKKRTMHNPYTKAFFNIDYSSFF
jgi:hypothetical protein